MKGCFPRAFFLHIYLSASVVVHVLGLNLATDSRSGSGVKSVVSRTQKHNFPATKKNYAQKPRGERCLPWYLGQLSRPSKSQQKFPSRVFTQLDVSRR